MIEFRFNGELAGRVERPLWELSSDFGEELFRSRRSVVDSVPSLD